MCVQEITCTASVREAQSGLRWKVKYSEWQDLWIFYDFTELWHRLTLKFIERLGCLIFYSPIPAAAHPSQVPQIRSLHISSQSGSRYWCVLSSRACSPPPSPIGPAFSPLLSRIPSLPLKVPSLPGIRSLAGWQTDGTDEDGRDWLIPNLLSPCHSGPQRREGSRREREREGEGDGAS